MDNRARDRARVALGIDAGVLAVFCLFTHRRAAVLVVGVGVLALGWAACRRPSLGYGLAVIRTCAALVVMVAAAESTVYLLLPLAEVVSAFNGWHAARVGRIGRRPRGTRRVSKRTDEIGSAIIHLGFIALIAIGVAADGRFAAAAGFVVWWVGVAWGTIAVHEAGHAIAARRAGNEVPEIHIGSGLTLFRVRSVSVGAIPFVGHAVWIPNESTMTSRREAMIALAGPGANVLVAAVLLAIPFVRADSLGLLVVVSQVLTALLNLVPRESRLNGRPFRSDGARALRLLCSSSLR